MKKNYIQPQIYFCPMDGALLNGGSVIGNNGVGWGGVDTAGMKDPDANKNNLWDDDNDWPKTHHNLFEE